MSVPTLPKYRRPDLWLLIATIALIVIGVMMIASTSSVVGYASYNDGFYFIKKHLMYLVLGVGMFLIGFRVPHDRYYRLMFWGLGLSCVAVILTMIPGIGVEAFGARRWLNVGVFTFQPVEVLKFFVIVYTAAILSNKRDKIRSVKDGLVPLFGVVLVPILLTAKQPDLGNVLLMGTVIFSLIFVAGARLLHLGTMIGVGAAGVVASVMIHPYQLRRIQTFLDPYADPLGQSYHIIQSFTAIGSGGIFGVGIGASRLKYSYLPLQYSDFIFSIICEEAGMAGATAVILLLCVFLWRGVRIALRSSTAYAYFLAIGLTLQIVVQSFINIAVVIGVFPTKGIPLAFISFGGTSLIMSMFTVGVLLNISRTGTPDAAR